jgi:hypothetical protein
MTSTNAATHRIQPIRMIIMILLLGCMLINLACITKPGVKDELGRTLEQYSYAPIDTKSAQSNQVGMLSDTKQIPLEGGFAPLDEKTMGYDKMIIELPSPTPNLGENLFFYMIGAEDFAYLDFTNLITTYNRYFLNYDELQLKEQYRFLYDDQKRRIRGDYLVKEDGVLLLLKSVEVVYNPHNQIDEIIYYIKEHLHYKIEVIYNDAQQLVLVEKVSRWNEREPLAQYTYDERGRLVQISKGRDEITYTYGESDEIHTYLWKRGSTVVEEATIEYTMEGQMTRSFFRSYNPTGHERELWEIRYSDGTPIRSRHSYWSIERNPESGKYERVFIENEEENNPTEIIMELMFVHDGVYPKTPELPVLESPLEAAGWYPWQLDEIMPLPPDDRVLFLTGAE